MDTTGRWMMVRRDLLPAGERLRRAICWIGQLGMHDMRSLETACVRYDLNPLECMYVLAHFAGDGRNTRSG